MTSRLSRKLLVTGGAGFIGTNFVHYWNAHYPEDNIVVLDALTYAGNRLNLLALAAQKRIKFVHGDIADRALVSDLLTQAAIDTVVHFAAESHVDRSIVGPAAFIQTNVVGTQSLLEAFRLYWQEQGQPPTYRFHHISTDEVYGSLTAIAPPFTEQTAYAPNSPYAASKAGSDHLVRSYHHTYGLPTLVTNCSNNYGPYQFPEKLIPLVILNALQGQPLPIYGDGQHIRDWLHVHDHCVAIDCVLHRGRVGETYNVGGLNQLTNLAVVHQICAVLSMLKPMPELDYASLITFVADRPGHDRRYAMDCSKITRELGWVPQASFESGLRQTVQWYLANSAWIEPVQSGAYQHWIDQNYRHRDDVHQIS